MVDMGWWFYMAREDGKPLTSWQFALWMMVSPIINLIFVIVSFIVAIVYVIGSIMLFPFFYFKQSYQNYRDEFEEERQKLWRALKNVDR